MQSLQPELKLQYHSRSQMRGAWPDSFTAEAYEIHCNLMYDAVRRTESYTGRAFSLRYVPDDVESGA